MKNRIIGRKKIIIGQGLLVYRSWQVRLGNLRIKIIVWQLDNYSVKVCDGVLVQGISQTVTLGPSYSNCHGWESMHNRKYKSAQYHNDRM